ncbi:hypothetical protein JCM10449v2_005564 [Rhodotorula kratochvilovae]
MPVAFEQSTQGSATPAPSSIAPVHKLACFRNSPRPCVNQCLVDELKPLRMWRFLQHDTQDERSISYATACSVIIGTPYEITSVEQARQLPKIGEKLILKVQEFLEKGFIQESRDVQNLERFKVLTVLNSVHGIGYKAANDLYDQGARNLHDVRRLLADRHSVISYLKYHADLQEKIPRSEVESIRDFIKIQLDKIQPGAKLELCGGYRRGKEFSNDVDVIITFPHQDGVERGVLAKLVHRLMRKGLIPEDGVLMHTTCGTDRTTWANRPAPLLDTLDKALVIFRHPRNNLDRCRDVWRRVDLVVAAWPHWGSAVVGWTGSTQFERDLRTWAKEKGYVFDSGGIRIEATNQFVAAEQEKDVFRVLGLEYIESHLRNADP